MLVKYLDRSLDGDESVAPEEGEPEWHQIEECCSVESFYASADEKVFGNNHDAESENKHDEIVWIFFDGKRGDNNRYIYQSEYIVI